MPKNESLSPFYDVEFARQRRRGGQLVAPEDDMIPRTLRNRDRLQTRCASCHHPEWDHYMHHGGSITACDSGGCRCRQFDEGKCEHGYGIKQGPCPTCDAPPFHEPGWRVVDLRDNGAPSMSWGVIDKWGVVTAQFDTSDDATKFVELMEGHR